jgi:hypothetical protein
MIIDSPIISGSYSASGSLNQFGDVVISGSLTVTGDISGTATSASYATTASYISGSGGGVGFPFSGSAVITGSLLITELSGSGTKYVITDNNGLLSISSGSTAIKVTETITSTSDQTSFTVPNGYTTGLVDVFINGIKLSNAEFTDNDGVTITLATGSNDGDIVEFAKYQPANGVTNNALRQLTTLTGSAGQTVFSASYTPGLLDIFYNGSRLSTSDYTANNGTYFTLATASAADDILDVLVYSYQVGAFNGIGGQGVVNQLAFFNTTSSISGSSALTISGNTLVGTASYASNADTLDGSHLSILATTGSNTFTSAQYISNTSAPIGFTDTASLYTDGGLRATRTSYFSSSVYIGGDLVIFGTQSVNYITSSQLNIADNIITVNTSSPAVRFGGIAVQDSGSLATGLTGSLLWDSQNNHWVYTNPSGSSYSGGMMISGPRASSLGEEQGTTNNALMKGQGGDHITSSAIFEVSGSVGMGLTNPSYKLHISGAFSSNPGLYVYGTTYGMVGVDRGSSASSAGINYYTTGSQRWFTGIYENTDNFGFYNAGIGNFPLVIQYSNGAVTLSGTSANNLIIDGTNINDRGTNMVFRSLGTHFGYIGSYGSLIGTTSKDMSIWATEGNGFRIFTNGFNLRLQITSDGNVGIGTTTPGVSLDLSSRTDAVRLTNGTTAQRPTAAAGQIRYNTSLGEVEVNNGSNWGSLQTKVMLGSSPSNPAESANDIKTYYPNATNGFYWIRQTGSTAVSAYCVFKDFTGADIQGGPWTVPVVSNDANTNYSTNGATAAATFLSRCQAIGINTPGRGMESSRTTTEVYGAWLAVKRTIWEAYTPFVANGNTSGGAVLRMPMININGEGGTTAQRLIYNTSLSTHIPPNIDGDSCNANQLFCGWWAATDISGWRTNNNDLPGPEDWGPADNANTSYNGAGVNSVLTICVYK